MASGKLCTRFNEIVAKTILNTGHQSFWSFSTTLNDSKTSSKERTENTAQLTQKMHVTIRQLKLTTLQLLKTLTALFLEEVFLSAELEMSINQSNLIINKINQHQRQ